MLSIAEISTSASPATPSRRAPAPDLPARSWVTGSIIVVMTQAPWMWARARARGSSAS